jgi:hypothetical protein
MPLGRPKKERGGNGIGWDIKILLTKKIKSRLNLGNSSYHSVQNFCLPVRYLEM